MRVHFHHELDDLDQIDLVLAAVEHGGTVTGVGQDYTLTFATPVSMDKLAGLLSMLSIINHHRQPGIRLDGVTTTPQQEIQA